MPLTWPNILTLLRIVSIPLFILVYYLPYQWSNSAAAIIFVIAGLTDWLDGYLARRLGQTTRFGAFLDPVADKLMVAAALIVLATDQRVLNAVWDYRLFAIVVLVIIGREIAVSALREWMASFGLQARVAVSYLGKIKTSSQILAIVFLIWRSPVQNLPVLRIGEMLLYLAGALTLWSMLLYLRAAWPNLVAGREHR